MAEHSLTATTFPVLLPEMPELRLDKLEFDAYVKSSLCVKVDDVLVEEKVVVSQSEDRSVKEAPFMQALLADKATAPSFDNRDGKMLTENADAAYRTSGDALVDLFFELEDVISASRLKYLLEKAWQQDPEATLRIIWNARSIHIGKSSRLVFYRAVGWLAEHHPTTLILNLPWLVRPLIRKKQPKKDQDGSKQGNQMADVVMFDAKDADSDFELIDAHEEELEGQPEQKKMKLTNAAVCSEFDIKFGVSHGYWKDLLNLLALAANNQLRVDGNPRSVLNIEKPSKKKRDWSEGRKKGANTDRHIRAVQKLKQDSFYKTLHLAVARLFAEQLKTDLARLQSGQKAEVKRITLAAKWAPTHKAMHDQHTCIVSTIAELLHPFESGCAKGIDPADRELYLKHARIAYQSQTLSPLRKHLKIVERDITAETFDQITYERVPSVAMARYTPLFAKKDFAHFDNYIEKVATGKARISGATLRPSTLVAAVIDSPFSSQLSTKAKGADQMVEKKLKDIHLKSIDGQWQTLVQRIKDSGTLESSLAVCDVSGSMVSPRFPDGTCPMDSSIGLSLLLAEVTKPPFGVRSSLSAVLRKSCA